MIQMFFSGLPDEVQEVRYRKFKMNTIRFLKGNCQFDQLDLNESLLGLKLLQEQKLMDDMQKLSCKMVFIHGEKDTTAPFENTLKLSKVFKNSKVHTSSKGDHQFFLKEADFVWKTIQEFSKSEEYLQKTLSNEH